MSDFEFGQQLLLTLLTVCLSALIGLKFNNNQKTEKVKRDKILTVTSSEISEFGNSNITSRSEIKDALYYLKYEWFPKFKAATHNFFRLGRLIRAFLYTALVFGLAPLPIIILQLLRLIPEGISSLLIKSFNIAVVTLFIMIGIGFCALIISGNTLKKQKLEYDDIMSKASKIR